MNRNSNIRCPEYLDWVGTKPCLVHGTRPVDKDHLKARGGGAGKQNDLTAIPLCRECHVERGQIGNSKFEAKYSINLWEEVSWLLIEFFVENADRHAEVMLFVSAK